MKYKQDIERLKKGLEIIRKRPKGGKELADEFLVRLLEQCMRLSIEYIQWYEMPKEERFFLNEVYDLLGIE